MSILITLALTIFAFLVLWGGIKSRINNKKRSLLISDFKQDLTKAFFICDSADEWDSKTILLSGVSVNSPLRAGQILSHRSGKSYSIQAVYKYEEGKNDEENMPAELVPEGTLETPVEIARSQWDQSWYNEIIKKESPVVFDLYEEKN